ncbi:MAG: EamA family transporter [Candidatus Dojkabacteria bacterium]|nr:MAG: EamA family transporter [Candidatus Dojkabacteria bacterium]
MNWFLISLLPPALWSITNHIDKYLLSKYFKGGGVGALMIFSSLIGAFLLPIIYIIHPAVFESITISHLIIVVNGFLYVLAILPYLYVLQKDEATIAVPLFQLIPVYSFILGFLILGETLSVAQLIGGFIIVTASVFIALDITNIKKIKFKLNVFLLMALSSLLFSLNFIFFKLFAVEANFFVTSFWEYVGFVLCALCLLLVKKYRQEFLDVLKTNSKVVLATNGINEVINILAKVSFNIASLLVPVTLVWIVNGSQPIFVFIYGVIITLFFPKLGKENISKPALIQKVIGILVIFVGTIVVNL